MLLEGCALVLDSTEYAIAFINGIRRDLELVGMILRQFNYSQALSIIFRSYLSYIHFLHFALLCTSQFRNAFHGRKTNQFQAEIFSGVIPPILLFSFEQMCTFQFSGGRCRFAAAFSDIVK